MTAQGQAASACPSPGPPHSYFRPADSLGCPSSLGSVSRMQTRQHERLVLNPKRIPLRAPSRGNRAVHTVRPAGATRLEDGDSAGQRAGFSAQCWLRSERAIPGPVVRVMEPHCRQETPQLCAGHGWSAGGRVSVAGRGQQQALWGSRPWRGGQQAVAAVDSRTWPRWTAALSWVGCAGWAGDRWAVQTLGSSPWGLGRRQPVSHCSWLGSDLSWEAASLSPLCFLGQSSVPRAKIHACCPVSRGRRGVWAQLLLVGPPELICPGQK